MFSSVTACVDRSEVWAEARRFPCVSPHRLLSCDCPRAGDMVPCQHPRSPPAPPRADPGAPPPQVQRPVGAGGAVCHGNLGGEVVEVCGPAGKGPQVRRRRPSVTRSLCFPPPRPHLLSAGPEPREVTSVSLPEPTCEGHPQPPPRPTSQSPHQWTPHTSWNVLPRPR